MYLAHTLTETLDDDARAERHRTGAEHVQWNAADLAGDEVLDLAAHGAHLRQRAAAIRDELHGRIADLTPDSLAAELARIEDLLGDAMRPLLSAQLRMATNTSDPAAAARGQAAHETASALQSDLGFMVTELMALPDAGRQQLREAPPLRSRRQWLASLWQAARFSLSGPEERVLHEKAPTGVAAWRQLFITLVSRLTVPLDGEELSLEQALGLLEQSDIERREAAARAISAALEKDIETRAYMLDTVVHDAVIEDRLRGRRDWLTSAATAMGIAETTARTVLDAVERRGESLRRHHRFKARLMGLERLRYDRDRLAPAGTGVDAIPWDTARHIVVDGFTSLSPAAGAIAERTFGERWIDARPSPTKAPHAFTIMVPGRHPHVLLSYHGTLRSLLTLAHEVGRAIHLTLASEQPLLVATPPPLIAEAVSLLGEHLVLRLLMAAQPEPRDRLPVLMTLLDSAMNMVFRHAAMTRFEGSLHEARRQGGQLTAPSISDLWMAANHTLVGGSAELSESFRHWWSHIPHLVSVPGGELHHTLALLVAQALHQRLAAGGEAAAGRLVAMMTAGGSLPLEELSAMAGVRLDDPALWDEQLDALDATVAEAEGLAAGAAPTGGGPG